MVHLQLGGRAPLGATFMMTRIASTGIDAPT
jgi:hypothetical protein